MAGRSLRRLTAVCAVALARVGAVALRAVALRAVALRRVGAVAVPLRGVGSVAVSLRGVAAVVLRRAGEVAAVACGVTWLSFVVVAALPTAAVAWLGADASPEQIARLEASLGFDQPVGARYVEWLARVARGDFGTSIASGEPVVDMLARRLPVTLLLAVYGIGGALLLAVPTALVCAHGPHGALDRAVLALSAWVLAIPSYVLALLLVLALASFWPVLPAIGYVPPAAGPAAHLRTMTLPALSIALPLAAFYLRFLRGELVAQMAHEPYVLTAAAKGLSRMRVLTRHALRMALSALTTVVALGIAPLLGGTVVIEQLFALPGLGSLLLQAVALQDSPVIQAVVLVIALLTVSLHFALETLHAALDPRLHDRADTRCSANG